MKDKTFENFNQKSVGELVDTLTSDPENDQPFFVADLGDVVYKIKFWKLKLPRVQPFYAVKCNDNPAVLELLSGLGLGFDCASKSEIDTIKALGVHSSRIIYANPCKTRSFIKHAASLGVDLMTFDNEMELYKVKELFPNARLVIRIKVDDTGAQCQLGLKFGCKLEDAEHLLKVAKHLELNVVGVSFHVGSNSKNPSTFREAIFNSRGVFDVGQSLGFNMQLLDIGGGYPGDKGTAAIFDEIATTINKSLDEYFPEETGVTIIAEPGRFFVSSAFTLYTTIIARREVLDDKKSVNMYYLNDGVYGSFNCTIFDHQEVQPVVLHGEGRSTTKCSLWGPTCDSMDLIKDNVELPQMEVGDWVVFENMGAYTICAASNFNGFQKPEIKYVLAYPTVTYLKRFSNWPRLACWLGDSTEDVQSRPCLDSDVLPEVLT